MNRLRELRELRKITQSDVANQLYISRQSYNFYENGQREPNLEMLIKLSDFYQVSIDYLLGRTDNPLLMNDPSLDKRFLLALKSADAATIANVWQFLNYLESQKEHPNLAAGEKK